MLDYIYEVALWLVPICLIIMCGCFLYGSILEWKYGPYLSERYDVSKQKDRVKRWKEQKAEQAEQREKRNKRKALKKAYRIAKKEKMMKDFLDKNKK